MIGQPSFESLMWFERFCQRAKDEMNLHIRILQTLTAPKAVLAINRKLDRFLCNETNEESCRFYGVTVSYETALKPTGQYLADVYSNISLWHGGNIYRMIEVIFTQCVLTPEDDREINWSKEGF